MWSVSQVWQPVSYGAWSRTEWDGRDSLLGVVVGGGVFIVIIVVSSFLLGQPGMGVGDVKLGAMLGAFLGWKLALLSILLSVLVGGLLAAHALGQWAEGEEGSVAVRAVPRAGRRGYSLLG